MKKPVIFLLSGLLGMSGAVSAETNSSPPRFQSELKLALDKALAPANKDPNEPVNRKMFHFNAWFVQTVVNPVANWLDTTLPEIAKQAGHNIYEILVEPEFIVTNSFVGDYDAAKMSVKRFLINSTLGVAGLWDPATKMGYRRTEVEFTESLCVAGIDPGNFIVLPVIGPASSHSALLLTGFFAVEWYLLAHISPLIATADLVIDLSASAASLRYARDVPNTGLPGLMDPYLVQRMDYVNYLEPRCGGYLKKRPVQSFAFEERSDFFQE